MVSSMTHNCLRRIITFLIIYSVYQLNLLQFAHASSICYLPDKSVASSRGFILEPCNATAAAGLDGSACCDLRNSVCMTNGYCFGSQNLVYRGGCTDANWNSPQCPANCLNSESQLTHTLAIQTGSCKDLISLADPRSFVIPSSRASWVFQRLSMW